MRAYVAPVYTSHNHLLITPIHPTCANNGELCAEHAFSASIDSIQWSSRIENFAESRFLALGGYADVGYFMFFFFFLLFYARKF